MRRQNFKSEKLIDYYMFVAPRSLLNPVWVKLDQMILKILSKLWRSPIILKVRNDKHQPRQLGWALHPQVIQICLLCSPPRLNARIFLTPRDLRTLSSLKPAPEKEKDLGPSFMSECGFNPHHFFQRWHTLSPSLHFQGFFFTSFIFKPLCRHFEYQ